MRYALNYTISYPLVSLKRSPELRKRWAGKFSIAPTADACVMESPSIKGFSDRVAAKTGLAQKFVVGESL
jgi:hypothetical protein